MRKVNTEEDAVSPVVGVMLMLVVTIVIGAIIASFSGAIVGGASGPNPTITFKADLSAETGLTLKSLGVANPKADTFSIYLKNGNQEYNVGRGSVEGFSVGSSINIDTTSIQAGFVNAFSAYNKYEESAAYVSKEHVGNIYEVLLYSSDGRSIIGKKTVTLKG